MPGACPLELSAHCRVDDAQREAPQGKPVACIGLWRWRLVVATSVNSTAQGRGISVNPPGRASSTRRPDRCASDSRGGCGRRWPAPVRDPLRAPTPRATRPTAGPPGDNFASIAFAPSSRSWPPPALGLAAMLASRLRRFAVASLLLALDAEPGEAARLALSARPCFASARPRARQATSSSSRTRASVSARPAAASLPSSRAASSRNSPASRRASQTSTGSFSAGRRWHFR